MALNVQEQLGGNELTCLHDQARDYARRSKADSTLRAYRFDWANFTQWCNGRGRAVLPARVASRTLLSSLHHLSRAASAQ